MASNFFDPNPNLNTAITDITICELESQLESTAKTILEGSYRSNEEESTICRESVTDLALALVLHALWTPPEQTRPRSCSMVSTASRTSSAGSEVHFSHVGLSRPSAHVLQPATPVRKTKLDKRLRWSLAALRLAESLESIQPFYPSQNDCGAAAQNPLESPAHVATICRRADRSIRLNFGAAIDTKAYFGLTNKDIIGGSFEDDQAPPSPTATEHSIVSTDTLLNTFSSETWNMVSPRGLTSSIEADSDDPGERAANLMSTIVGLAYSMNRANSTEAQSLASIESQTAMLRACVRKLRECYEQVEEASPSSSSIQLGFYRLIGEVFEAADAATTATEVSQVAELSQVSIRLTIMCMLGGT